MFSCTSKNVSYLKGKAKFELYNLRFENVTRTMVFYSMWEAIQAFPNQDFDAFCE